MNKRDQVREYFEKHSEEEWDRLESTLTGKIKYRIHREMMDRNLPEDDHRHSMDPDLLEPLAANIRIVEQATAPLREITESELPARKNARRSIVAVDDIPAGTTIGEAHIMAKRPGGGISPSFWDQVCGRTVKTDIKKDQQLKWNDFQ